MAAIWSVILWTLSLLIVCCSTQDYIDDIPIESYNHGDHKDNELDLELLPTRISRSFDNNDAKEYFLRYFDDVHDIHTFGPSEHIPRPIFHTTSKRRRRSTTSEESPLTILKNLGKPLEVVTLEVKNLTEGDDKAESRMDMDAELSINDFIRFRRSTDVSSSGSEKIIMDSTSEPLNREARGVTTDHWVKQPYPIRKDDEVIFSDNMPLSSENVKAPRVHFVTQKFSESRPAHSEIRPFEREARSRQMDRELPRETPIGGFEGYFDRKYTSFLPERPFLRDDMYTRYHLRDYRDAYRPRFDHYELPVQKRQKRIIYYATLPEISRSPPNVDLRDRYRYRFDRYDDPDYRFRKSLPKSRYEEDPKAPYPVNVLTDVNVREVKKNPERRIYSEVDNSRYAYNSPSYRTEG